MSAYNIKRIGRRHFLLGTGGTALAIPALQSLEEPEAAAQFTANPRFVCMVTGHGGVWGSHMYPDQATANTARQLFPGHNMHSGPLVPAASGGTTSLSPCLSAPSTQFPSSLAAKMNIIRGLDITDYMGHHTGGPLGNYARRDGEGDESYPYIPTIDQVMAYSPNFYPDIDQIRVRSMHVQNGLRPLSYGYEAGNPANPVVEIPPIRSSIALFNQIYVAPPDPGEEPRPLVVDRVYEHYRRLRDGEFGDASRLSRADRDRLDAHMDRMLELERRLNVVVDCGNVPVPTVDGGDVLGSNEQSQREYWSVFNDVVIAAFACGTSRIAIYGSNGEFTDMPYEGNWHQDVMHDGGNGSGQFAALQAVCLDNHRNFFQSAFLDLVTKLDAIDEGNGVTALDNSLVMWTQESGHSTHDNIGTPVVTAGSAGGFFNTGNYGDFRRRDVVFAADQSVVVPEDNTTRPGILYNQWLANVLQSMNVTPAEFESGGRTGYGIELPRFHFFQGGLDPLQMWPDRVLNTASDLLPVVVAGV